MTARIPLRDRSGTVVAHALVDDEDEQEVLEQGRWSLHRTKGHAYRMEYLGGGRAHQRQRLVQLHRFVLGLPPSEPHVDHRNHDRLDCRKANLRLVTNAQNQQNRQGGYGSSSQRGVSWDRARSRWKAYAKLDGRMYHLGRFDSEEAAAAAASAWRSDHMPFSGMTTG